MSQQPGSFRVVSVGTGRRRSRWGLNESERAWRQRLAEEMEGACQEMERRGLRLVRVVPHMSSISFQGSWTEGAWLFFAAEPAPRGEDARLPSPQWAHEGAV